jgi:hypothetical protein
MAFPEGSTGRVEGEQALIVWDGQVQHFIRRANFSTGSLDLGFIVPTPSRPTLDEVGDEALGRFEQLLAEALTPVRRVRFEPGSALLEREGFAGASAASLSGKDARSFGVHVLEEKRVAGLDAAVLEADDPEALRQWLQARGYAARPALIDWLRPYIAQRWKLTAFKLARERFGETLTARAVRLSFPTTRPVYPYREPADTERPESRTLRLFFVGPTRMDGVLGDKPVSWSARVKLARDLGRPDALLAGTVPSGTLPDGAWLTIFDDDSRQRALGEELFFQPSLHPHPYEPPRPVEVRTVRVPVELGLAPLALVGLVWVARRRRLATLD